MHRCVSSAVSIRKGRARAVERATQLLLEIAGGDAGPLVVNTADKHLPSRSPVVLRKDRLTRLLGLEIADQNVVRILEGLEFRIDNSAGGWKVSPPSHRFDIEIEADLIEEVARIHGYDSIPETTAFAESPLERSIRNASLNSSARQKCLSHVTTRKS